VGRFPYPDLVVTAAHSFFVRNKTGPRQPPVTASLGELVFFFWSPGGRPPVHSRSKIDRRLNDFPPRAVVGPFSSSKPPQEAALFSLPSPEDVPFFSPWTSATKRGSAFPCYKATRYPLSPFSAGKGRRQRVVPFFFFSLGGALAGGGNRSPPLFSVVGEQFGAEHVGATRTPRAFFPAPKNSFFSSLREMGRGRTARFSFLPFFLVCADC